jgi:hypothetical protein
VHVIESPRVIPIMRSLTFALLLASLALAACGTQAVSKQPSAHVSGHVYWYTCPGGIKCAPTPMNKAALRFRPLSGTDVTVLTKVDGSYQVDLAAGMYRVLVPRPLVQGQTDIHLEPGQRLIADYLLQNATG